MDWTSDAADDRLGGGGDGTSEGMPGRGEGGVYEGESGDRREVEEGGEGSEDGGGEGEFSEAADNPVDPVPCCTSAGIVGSMFCSKGSFTLPTVIALHCSLSVCCLQAACLSAMRSMNRALLSCSNLLLLCISRRASRRKANMLTGRARQASLATWYRQFWSAWQSSDCLALQAALDASYTERRTVRDLRKAPSAQLPHAPVRSSNWV